MKSAMKGVAVRGINIGDVRALQIPLPSRAEQDEIVRRVEELFSHRDQMVAKLQRALGQVERMSNAVLVKAFCGQLVPHNPEDEPASEFLAKLKALRSTSAAESTRARTKIPRKGFLMSNVDKDAIRAAILRLKSERFSFDKLRSLVPGDYESVKAAIFELLEEPTPFIRQIFDEKANAMLLVRVRS
jgi:type I restriction enzyme S subunit